jgi:O-antigen ligase
MACALTLVLGFDGGGFVPTSWFWSAVVLGIIAVALLARQARKPSTLELAFLAALAGLVFWALCSASWSLDPTASVLDAERLLLYLSAAAALLLLARPGSRPGILVGVLVGIGVLSAAGLLDAVVGDDPIGVVSDDPVSADRLAEPIGYANGMAVLAAMGALVAFGLALATPRRDLRAACLALDVVFVATLYLTYSRGAWLALALGLLALFAVRLGSLDRRVVVVVCAVLAISAAAAGVAFARSFAVPTTTPVEGAARLRTLSGSTRAEYWGVALRTVASEPLLGAGAGSFRRRWYRHRPVPQPASDAHSLYLETLAELGPLGLMLLLATLSLPLAAALATRHDPITSAALGAYVAALAHAGQDWDWELPAAVVPALACAAVLLLGKRVAWAQLGPAARWGGAAASLAIAVMALAAYAGNRELALAQGGSEGAARRAAKLQPWSSEPWRVLGEAQLERGELERARVSFRKGVLRDDGDWELWLDLALASEGEQKREAFERAAELNPRDPDVQELRGE